MNLRRTLRMTEPLIELPSDGVDEDGMAEVEVELEM